MAVRPHRKASLKQLVKLSEEHWNAPRDLVEILAELRHRDDSEAEPVIRSIVRRLSLLNYHPEDDAAGERDDPSIERDGDAATQKRRRRLLLALVPVAAAAAVAAVMLWPQSEPPGSKEAQGGLDLTAQGERHERASSQAMRTGQPSTPPTVSVETVAWPPAEAHRRAPHHLVLGAGGPQLHGSTADLFVTPPPDASRLDPKRSDEIGPNILNGQIRRPAEDGVYIGQARLRCYMTNSDPSACGRNLWGGNTRPGPVANLPPELAEQRAAQAGFGHPQPPGIARPITAAAAPIGGMPPTMGEPHQPRGPRPAESVPHAPFCPPPPIGRAVFVLDASLSMGLPLGVSAELEDRLDQAILNKERGARHHYRELLAAPGPKRITRAREAFTAAARNLPSWIELGLVVFRECKDIRKVGVYQPDERSKAIDYIRSLIPRGRTPIAHSLRVAEEMLGDGPSSIILLTDGRESCSGDPCQAAAELHARHPQTPINVIDISGQANARCIAAATGGRVYTPGAGDDLGRVIQNAIRGADASCPLYDGDNPPTATASRQQVGLSGR